MGMMIASSKPTRVQYLPLTVKFNMDVDSMPNDPIAVFSLAGNPGACDLRLNIIKTELACLTVLVPESLLAQGPGLYDVTLYDGCIPCVTQQLRLARNCKVRSCVVEEAQPEKPEGDCGKFQTPLN